MNLSILSLVVFVITATVQYANATNVHRTSTNEILNRGHQDRINERNFVRSPQSIRTKRNTKKDVTEDNGSEETEEYVDTSEDDGGFMNIMIKVPTKAPCKQGYTPNHNRVCVPQITESD